MLEKEFQNVGDISLDDIIKEEKPNKSGKRKSLGRGLVALLGDDDFDIDLTPKDMIKSGATFVNVELLAPSKYQPRKDFDKEALESLVKSIEEKGVLQPLLVRKQGDGYEIIAGERRWRASKIAGLKQVPVIEKDFNDKEVLEVALVENLLRENLSAIEEAEGFQRLMNEFSHTQEALANIVGKSRSHIANTVRLLTLPEDVKSLIKENKISAGHARALVGLENASSLARKVVEKDLNVRQVEDLVSKQKAPKNEVKPAKNKAAAADIKDIEKDLTRKLGLKLKISPGKNGGGKVVLNYSSVAELDRIIEFLERNKV
ncbi:MAG: ParB/RepB/Spo0J family partition protein [Lactobacillaceae bacterium]|jgi:ParB family chromosome partitioning protein|nr:ParB/RepB/Spo0J family partition protein [Lactobacillaceae bacterium]